MEFSAASPTTHPRKPLFARWSNGAWVNVSGPWTGFGVMNAVRAVSLSNAWSVGSIGSYTFWTVGTVQKNSCVLRPLHHNEAAVDGENLSGDVRGFIGGQKGDRVGNLLGRAEAAKGRPVGDL